MRSGTGLAEQEPDGRGTSGTVGEADGQAHTSHGVYKQLLCIPSYMHVPF